MAEALDIGPSEDSLPTQWKASGRRLRKSGCSNIFSEVNLHQLHRLFRAAGDRNAEHRAKLVWQDMEADVEEGDEDGQSKDEERGEEAGLAQALVGLRVRARNKAGRRVEGNRDRTWVTAGGYLRVEPPLDVYPEDNDDPSLSLGQFCLPGEEEAIERQNPFKPSSWRLGARIESGRDSERYLHRILH